LHKSANMKVILILMFTLLGLLYHVQLGTSTPLPLTLSAALSTPEIFGLAASENAMPELKERSILYPRLAGIIGALDKNLLMQLAAISAFLGIGTFWIQSMIREWYVDMIKEQK
jgi:hypothetical protein